jgi:hypothetical protein
MIVAHLPDEPVEFDDATRFSTDEHNNLCIWGGKKTDALLAVFNAAVWVRVQVDDDDQG